MLSIPRSVDKLKGFRVEFWGRAIAQAVLPQAPPVYIARLTVPKRSTHDSQQNIRGISIPVAISIFGDAIITFESLWARRLTKLRIG